MAQTILSRYLHKANNIITDSIKSAVFIDEKALEFYTPVRSNTELGIEEQLSIDLFNKFKELGISMIVHKFKPDDINSDSTKRFLFEDRDLVLLDWKLDGNEGELYSLKLLSDIVSRPHIHFCSIYTSETNNDEIINNIISYFSGKDKSYYENLKSYFRDTFDNSDELKRILNAVSIDNDNLERNKDFKIPLRSIDPKLPKEISDRTEGLKTGLKDIKIALQDQWHKSEIANSNLDAIDRESSVLLINNTIITILNKSNNKPNLLLKKLSRQIAKSDNSFTKLLGIEMHNLISKGASFIDPNLLNVSRETLLYHRKTVNENGSEIPFGEFVKSIFLEQTGINLQSEQLSLLDSDFLDSITNNRFKPANSESALINTFYNGTIIIRDERALNFGDIFQYGSQYFLCITALCDCHLFNGISNVKFKYFFVKGLSIPLEKGIKLGDKGFISYINNSTCISWTGSGEDALYAKPVQLFIPDPLLRNGFLKAKDWNDTTGSEFEFELQYKFTLRQQYAQRIANHAFAHPIRVGVDFAKNLKAT